MDICRSTAVDNGSQPDLCGMPATERALTARPNGRQRQQETRKGNKMEMTKMEVGRIMSEGSYQAGERWVSYLTGVYFPKLLLKFGGDEIQAMNSLNKIIMSETGNPEAFWIAVSQGNYSLIDGMRKAEASRKETANKSFASDFLAKLNNKKKAAEEIRQAEAGEEI